MKVEIRWTLCHKCSKPSLPVKMHKRNFPGPRLDALFIDESVRRTKCRCYSPACVLCLQFDSWDLSPEFPFDWSFLYLLVLCLFFATYVFRRRWFYIAYRLSCPYLRRSAKADFASTLGFLCRLNTTNTSPKPYSTIPEIHFYFLCINTYQALEKFMKEIKTSQSAENYVFIILLWKVRWRDPLRMHLSHLTEWIKRET